MAEDMESEVRNIISEIVGKSADGDYIYRGEPGGYEQPSFDGKVSSNLWRQFRSAFCNRADFDCRLLQAIHLTDARKHEADLHQDDFDLASELQHLGGKTNLIDFTMDCLVALFFACDGAYEEPGRVILFERTEDKRRKYHIEAPQHPENRVAAQKSVFVEHPSGVIDGDDIEEIICIEPSFKKPILTHLRKKGICTQNLYTSTSDTPTIDYIKHQQNHHDAYIEYGMGVLRYCYSAICKAIKHLSNAIKFYPDFVEAHLWRANIYLWTKDFDKAIKGYTKVIELIELDDCARVIEYDPGRASVYFRRGEAYFKKGCSARAEQDLIRAIELGEGFAHDLLLEVRARLNQ